MGEIDSFIAAARSKGLHDGQITAMLKAAGWEEAIVQGALLGLEVPTPLSRPETEKHSTIHKSQNSISALEAALQHILLWVFTGTSSIMIGIVSAALFGANDPTSTTLQTYLVIEALTFIPYALLFGHFIRNFQKQPDLKTGRVWSIMTIVIHSLGLIGGLITFILAIVLVSDHDTKIAMLVASAAIACMAGLVTATYVAANFAKNTHASWRKLLVTYSPIVLLIIIGFFGIYALMKLGPIKSNDTTRQHLIDATKAVRDYTRNTGALPTSLSQTDKSLPDVSYQKRTNTRYELCADFKITRSHDYDYASNYPLTDSYVSDYDFINKKTGKNCFNIDSDYLVNRPYYLNSNVAQEQPAVNTQMQ